MTGLVLATVLNLRLTPGLVQVPGLIDRTGRLRPETPLPGPGDLHQRGLPLWWWTLLWSLLEVVLCLRYHRPHRTSLLLPLQVQFLLPLR